MDRLVGRVSGSKVLVVLCSSKSKLSQCGSDADHEQNRERRDETHKREATSFTLKFEPLMS